MVNRTLVRLAAAFCILLAGNLFASSTAVLLSLVPDATIAGTGAFTLTVNGANFQNGATIFVANAPRITNFVSSSQLTATVQAGEILSAGTLQVTVANPGQSQSTPLPLTVYPNSPTITSFTPSSVPQNSTSLNVTINGSNFASSAVARVNGNARTTAYVSPTQLTMTLTASDVAHIGTLPISVLNPNAHISPTVNLSVTAPNTNPTISLLDPATIPSGNPSFTLTVVGTNFQNGATVKVNSAARVTTFVDSQHLTATILASDAAVAGNLTVIVNNPDGHLSNSATLTVTSSTMPTITSLSPSSVTAGTNTFTVTITGTHFTSNAQVLVNGQSRPFVFTDSEHINAQVQSADVTTAGQVPIVVKTLGTNGGTSDPFPLYVTAMNAPVASTLSPSTLATNTSSLNVLINGSGFLFNDVALFDGAQRVTQFVSATQIAITLLSSDVATAGTHQISVQRNDGSATSAPLTLTVVNAGSAAITSITPPMGQSGASSLQIDVLGQNFESGAIVTVDGSPRDTVFVSATELHATLTAEDLATPRDLTLAVLNPDNTTSQAVVYTVANAVPAITSITPSTVVAGDSGFQLNVAGTNFDNSAVINVNGQAVGTSVQNSTGNLLAQISADQIATPGSLQITITDNGATSAAVSLTIRRPTITGVTPANIPVGSTSATITVTGDAFLPTSTIVFKGTDHATTFNSDGTLSATLSSTDLADVGQFAVTVRNTATASSDPFLINVVSVGTPTITSYDPLSVTVGSAPAVLNVFGQNFTAQSVIVVNGSRRDTTVVADGHLQTTLLASDLATPGTLHVTVANPDQTSSEVLVTVSGPTIIPMRRRGFRP